jgi:hypothetical protein
VIQAIYKGIEIGMELQPTGPRVLEVRLHTDQASLHDKVDRDTPLSQGDHEIHSCQLKPIRRVDRASLPRYSTVDSSLCPRVFKQTLTRADQC